MAEIARWGDMNRGSTGLPYPYPDDEPVLAGDGCPYYKHDPKIFYGSHDRMRELAPAPATFRASPDICHMLGSNPCAPDLGYTLNCDRTLPPNSIVLEGSNA